jgi:hypothetical protein
LVRHPSPYAKTVHGAAATENPKPIAEPPKPAGAPQNAAQKPIWTTKVAGDSVIVKSPYAPSIPKAFKQLSGRWSPSENAWVIPARYKAQAEQALIKSFGANDEERVDVRIKTDGTEIGYYQEFWLGQHNLNRPSRDAAVRKSWDIAVIEGGFPASGGSWKHPRLRPLPGTVLEITGVPKSLAEQAKAKYGDNVEIIKPK